MSIDWCDGEICRVVVIGPFLELVKFDVSGRNEEFTYCTYYIFEMKMDIVVEMLAKGHDGAESIAINGD